MFVAVNNEANSATDNVKSKVIVIFNFKPFTKELFQYSLFQTESKPTFNACLRDLTVAVSARQLMPIEKLRI